MTTFAGALHARDVATRTPLDGWHFALRDNAGAGLARRLSGSPELRVVFHGLGAVHAGMRSYSPDGTLLHADDGKPMNAGVTTAGWQAAPHIVFAFRLADDPSVGVFIHTSTSWATADSLARSGLVDRLAEGGDVVARFSLQRHRFTSRNGPATGTLVDYSCAGVALE